MNFVDTHAHIHFDDYPLNADEVWQDAQTVGVTRMIAVACDVKTSESSVAFAAGRKGVYATVGVHPHNARKFFDQEDAKQRLEKLLDDAKANKIVAIGEFGLDYFYDRSPKEDQIPLLRYQLELVQRYNLPAAFHIRDAFADFWPIFDEFNSQQRITGVVHCFTATVEEMEQAVSRGLYVALNGIMTFTSDEKQLEAARLLPVDKLLLETDAPYLTPKPLRGKICKPEHVVLTAEFLAGLRGESIEEIASASTKNAIELFNL